MARFLTLSALLGAVATVASASKRVRDDNPAAEEPAEEPAVEVDAEGDAEVPPTPAGPLEDKYYQPEDLNRLRSIEKLRGAGNVAPCKKALWPLLSAIVTEDIKNYRDHLVGMPSIGKVETCRRLATEILNDRVKHETAKTFLVYKTGEQGARDDGCEWGDDEVLTIKNVPVYGEFNLPSTSMGTVKITRKSLFGVATDAEDKKSFDIMSEEVAQFSVLNEGDEEIGKARVHSFGGDKGTFREIANLYQELCEKPYNREDFEETMRMHSPYTYPCTEMVQRRLDILFKQDGQVGSLMQLTKGIKGKGQEKDENDENIPEFVRQVSDDENSPLIRNKNYDRKYFLACDTALRSVFDTFHYEREVANGKVTRKKAAVNRKITEFPEKLSGNLQKCYWSENMNDVIIFNDVTADPEEGAEQGEKGIVAITRQKYLELVATVDASRDVLDGDDQTKQIDVIVKTDQSDEKGHDVFVTKTKTIKFQALVDLSEDTRKYCKGAALSWAQTPAGALTRRDESTPISRDESTRSATPTADGGSDIDEVGDTDGSSCIAGQASLQLSDGSALAAKRLAVGHVVRTAAGFEQILAMIHKDDSATAGFLEIFTGLGAMTLSPRHVLFTADGASLEASEVQVGMKLRAAAGVAVVRSVRKAMADGFVAPVTASGTLVVDGVVASSYASVSHAGGHLASAPLRAAAGLASAFPTVPAFSARALVRATS